jgi:hypothetical protein
MQCILRHENVNTMQRFYIKTASAVAKDAMKKLEQKNQWYSSCTVGSGELIGTFGVA